MKTLRELTDAKIESGRKAKPEFTKGVNEVIAKAKQFQEGKNAIQVGQIAPNFELPNAKRELVFLNELLDNEPVVLTFYRGDWCPYCNLQLRALQARIAEIHEFGASLVAISPQVPDDSMSENEISKMDFIVLSDEGAKVASKYGVAWKVPDFLKEHMRVDRELDLAKINNGNGDILPIPATFIIAKDGKVKWNYVNVDYRMRSEPEEIIAALKKIV